MHQTYVKSKPCVDDASGTNDPALICGKPSFRKHHGWLCRDHYLTQQTSIPPKPRKAQPRMWKGDLRLEVDCRDIAKSERDIVAELTDNNKIRVRVFGALEPVILQTSRGPLTPASVEV